MSEWYDDHTDTYHVFDPATPDLTVTDNPVVARLYGPDGEPLLELTERDTIPFGFHPRR